MDTTAQDLETANRKLRSQSQADKEALAALTSSLEAAEARAEAAEAEANRLAKDQREKEDNLETEMVKQVRAWG